MGTPLAAFLIAFGTVTLAEMGDKTQLLTMAFAAKHHPVKVLLGVLAASALLNALAVAAGNLLARYETLGAWIQLAASLSFIGFALWSLRGEKPRAEKGRKARLGPVMTVAASFFVAELGDKTQLAAVALAAKFPEAPAPVFMGATLGLLAANGVGVFVGAVFCRRLPEKVFRLASAAAFLLFGLIGLWQAAADKLGAAAATAIAAAVAIAAGLAGWRMLRRGMPPSACE
jgi:putative Ca2+/H+ antiporter (TMEM165/GDT1 family)